MAIKNKTDELPSEVAAIIGQLRGFLNTIDEKGRKIGNYKYGVYAFYDYDGEPIYVGQTYESLRSRVGRHLTNQRTDAVAMNVLDPFEVAEIEVWPLDDQIENTTNGISVRKYLDMAEYTVMQQVLEDSTLGAILNEKVVQKVSTIQLPESYRKKIVPNDVYQLRKHPDVRLARRASTIASLARVISERKVSEGLRRTLLTQARRLELLASRRLVELGICESETEYSSDS